MLTKNEKFYYEIEKGNGNICVILILFKNSCSDFYKIMNYKKFDSLIRKIED